MTEEPLQKSPVQFDEEEGLTLLQESPSEPICLGRDWLCGEYYPVRSYLELLTVSTTVLY